MAATGTFGWGKKKTLVTTYDYQAPDRVTTNILTYELFLRRIVNFFTVRLSHLVALSDLV